MARKPRVYSLSRAAEADLEDIYAFTVSTCSVRQANRYLDDFEIAFKELAEGNRNGRPRPDIATGYLSLIVGSHLVIYRETEELWIVRILDAAMDLPRHLT